MKPQEEYIETSITNGTTCPQCGADDLNLQFGSFDLEGSNVFQEVLCTGCGLEWSDRYSLTGYVVTAGQRKEVVACN